MKPKQGDGKKETRIFQFEKLNVEQRADGLGPKITGYAAVFNKYSEDLGGFREKIKPGAFKKAIGKSDVRGLFNHDSNFVLGRQSAGTLRIKEDKNGLWMEIDPPDTAIIRDLVLKPIERGDIREQSFGFIVGRDEWDGLDNERSGEPITRTIIEVDELFDVSPVTFPAYPDTSVALRSMEQAKEPGFTVFDIHAVDAAQFERLVRENPGAVLDVIRKSLISSTDADAEPPADGEGQGAADQETLSRTEARLKALDKRMEKLLN